MQQCPVILFDGVCNFCNSAVNFVLKRNEKANILFAPMQSLAGQELLKRYGLPLNEMRSFVLIDKGKAYQRSTASLKVCRYLRGLWPLCYGLIIVPRVIRDGIYDWVAKNRYKWFGVRDQCMVPSQEIKQRFL